MKDVAILAGVSVGTVSNVLNRPEAVSEITRAKVQDAISKLGWIRNETARSLRAGRSHSIGLVVMDISNPFFTDMARGVEDVMTAAGYSVLLANSAEQSAREDLHLEQLGRQRVSGVVLAPVGAGIRTRILEQFGIPVVLADRAGNSPDMCTVSVDDFAGGRLAAAHLLEQGHSRLAFVGGNPRIRQVHDRHDGAAREVMLAGPDASLHAIATEHLDITAGRDIAAGLARMPETDRPTGVFAANDLVAIGLLQGLMTRGIRVPDDIAIVGYDDIEFAAAAAVPLSSIRQPRVELGRRAAELLLAEIDEDSEAGIHQHENVRFTPQLAARASSLGKTPARGRGPDQRVDQPRRTQPTSAATL
ncbi:MAG TPA: LacI family DNA-binding transcriptional regulator [Nakamurella sp.]